MTKAAKAVYDKAYRKRNRKRLRRSRAEWFKRTYDPVVAAVERKKTMPRHVEYCRQPEYRAYKCDYDRQRRASRYGKFAECYALLLMLRAEIKQQMPDRFERYAQAKRFAWNPDVQQRRREHAKQKQEKFLAAIGLASDRS